MSEPRLQSNWSLVKLVDCARIVSGATPRTSEPRYWDGGIKWVTPKDISDLDGYPFLDSTPRTLTAEGLASCSAEMLPPNSVLLSSRAPIGLVAINRIPVATNQGFKSFVPDASRLDAGYLYHWLRANRSFLENLGTGATFKEISKAVMTRVEIPLPPLDEQKRIAAVLDKADALRRQRQESLQLTEKLFQSIFIDMFGDPATNPRGWPMLELGRFGIVQTGNTPPRSNKANYAKEGLEWIKTDNIVEDREVVTPSLERLSEAGAKVARVAPAGSLLVACIAGSEKSIGRAALTDRRVAFNQQINSITPHTDTSPLFLYFLVKIARRQIQLAAAKGMKKMINKSTFEGLLFISPGYDEQLRFERVAQRLLVQNKDCQDQLVHLDSFFSSLQQRAFRGELDLSRLDPDTEAELPGVTPAPKPVAIQGRYTRPGSFIAPPEIEAQMMALEDRLAWAREDFIPWSEDYFKYRTLSQLLQHPFSFSEIWDEVYHDMPDANYETVKDKIFEYVEAGSLEQRFDEARKEIVFYPRA